MADFNVFLPKLLQWEGGFVDNPNDPGGATNRGITLDTFTLYASSILGEAPTLDNLKNLSTAQAGQIYKPHYWDKVLGDQINDQGLANVICDFAVNAGIYHAVTTVQTLLISMGFSQVSADGAIGPITLGAINSADPNSLRNSYKQARIAYYNQLVVHNPKLQGFLRGWINRVNSY